MALSLQTEVLTAWCRAGVVLEDWGSIASELGVLTTTGMAEGADKRLLWSWLLLEVPIQDVDMTWVIEGYRLDRNYHNQYY